MGVKFSTPQLQRQKSLSKFGRSSQRSLFQKTKTKLNAIQRRIESQTNHDEIRNELNAIENDLLSLSNTIKEKNKDKYEEIVQHFLDVKNKLPEIPKEMKTEEVVVENNTSPGNTVADVVSNAIVKVEDQDLQIKDIEDKDEEEKEDVEVRKPVEFYTRPASPSIKFGVQVMPIAPRVSQEMLKRNTLPTNEIAKAEFKEIRALSSDAKVIVHRTATTRVEENGNVVEFSRSSVEERPFQVKSNLNQVERVRKVVDELENTLKYFHGIKGDEDYQNLHHKFIQSLAKLENVESQDNPVVKQEKKILMQRIQELLKILERISEPIAAPVYVQEEIDTENSTGTAI